MRSSTIEIGHGAVAHSFEFERKVQRFLVSDGPLLVAIRQACVRETQVETRFLRGKATEICRPGGSPCSGPYQYASE